MKTLGGGLSGFRVLKATQVVCHSISFAPPALQERACRESLCSCCEVYKMNKTFTACTLLQCARHKAYDNLGRPGASKQHSFCATARDLCLQHCRSMHGVNVFVEVVPH
jgi:hypothetical protein